MPRMTLARVTAITIYINLGVAALHGAAHGALGVPVGRLLNMALVIATVYLGPVMALIQLRRDRVRSAGLLLAIAMLGACAYGLLFHFVLPTPDHVLRLPATGWGAVFRGTAAALVPLEAGGSAVGILVVFGARSSPQAPAPFSS